MTEAAPQTSATSNVFTPQSSRVPSATPLPPFFRDQKDQPPKVTSEAKLPHKQFSLPKLRLEIRDLNHIGAQTFLGSVTASEVLQDAVETVLKYLYESPDSRTTTVPSTRSVTLILRALDGVAYTTGTELDPDHKEIHLSLDYIHKHVALSRKAAEIRGVLTHEMVHCYQYNGHGTCPGGLIEGIADWVRLNAELGPPHWKKEPGDKWDVGYQHTGFFLEYLEGRFGQGTVRRMNEKLRIERYDEKRFWTELVGGSVQCLWSDYKQHLKHSKPKDEQEKGMTIDKEDVTRVSK